MLSHNLDYPTPVYRPALVSVDWDLLKNFSMHTLYYVYLTDIWLVKNNPFII